MLEAEVDAYLVSLDAVLSEVLGAAVEALWLVGSLATADFDLAKSDIDLFVVTGRSLTEVEKAFLGDRLGHASLPCPAHGLDMVAYHLPEITEARRSPRYECSIASGADWDDEVSFGGPYPGGIVDLALARERGVSLRGPGPGAIVAAYPSEWVISELRRGLAWHRTKVHDAFHDPLGSNAVLNACRALYYLHHSSFVSKSAGASWLLSRYRVEVVSEALAQRQTRRAQRPLARSDVLEFLDLVSAKMQN